MLGALTGTVFWCAMFVVSFTQDRRRVRNGVLFLIALHAVVSLVIQLVAALPLGNLVVLAGGAVAVLGVFALAIALVANGVTVARKEGRSLGNMLSLLAGLGLGAAPFAAVGLMATGSAPATALAVVIVLITVHLGLAFAVFFSASMLYQRFPRPMATDGIIVHGSGLVRGKVSPLLRSRLDRAVAFREEMLAQGRDPLLVPSGGQGGDEPCSEGEAMAEYLIETAGVPADRVRAETRSRTTEENLRYSHELLEAEGIAGPYVVVTSRYHAFRAALLARSLGYADEALGGATRFYYVPSATLREFIAVMTYRKWWNLLALAPIIALTVLMVLVMIPWM